MREHDEMLEREQAEAEEYRAAVCAVMLTGAQRD